MTTRAAWHLLSGEFPPGGGGVGEHTRLLATALAGAGEEVHVWAPRGSAGAEGFVLHPVRGFSGGGLRALAAGLDASAAPRRLLVQYAPQAFGRRGMNLGFCRWVLRRARVADEVRVFFHEPFVEFSARHPRRAPLATATHAMAWLLLRAASRVYLSTPAWAGLLRPLAPRGLPQPEWLPIPSTIPRVEDAPGVAEVRARLCGGAAQVLGHFGTYGGMITPLLRPVLASLLARPGLALLLLGEGGPAFAERLCAGDAGLRQRVRAPGRLPAEALSLHLQACDLLLQPYPDGVSARRTTAMAALANRVPLLSTLGRFSEPEWSAAGIPLTPAGDAGALAARAAELLDHPADLAAAAEAGWRLYHDRFAMAHTLATLLRP
jgi:glycosyltransferase involved in cell wall biosynthesis